jgi:chitinase
MDHDPLPSHACGVVIWYQVRHSKLHGSPCRYRSGAACELSYVAISHCPFLFQLAVFCSSPQVTLSRLYPNCKRLLCVLSLSSLITIFTGFQPSLHSIAYYHRYNPIIMSRSTLSRAAAAAALFASTASAAFSLAANNNVAIYWGQGAYQSPLSRVCADPSIDVVNIAFVNEFPNKVGDFPNTNFGNACGGAFYKHPTDPNQDKKLLASCPSITEGIKVCQDNGKKVLLSLGGGEPTSYYLPSEEVAKYFAEFLMGAFGPVTKEWTAKNGPRPFGDAVVDGFDLDLEAQVQNVPKPGDISANYAYFVRQLKAIQSSLLISAAPQCEVPDPRLADAIANAPFDMIFTQFYNTPKCSARTGITQFNNPNTDFTFKAWAQFLQSSSNNPAVKLYLGLPASPSAAPSYPDHYLTPKEADALSRKWKNEFPAMFGGIMLWEDKHSEDNVIDCHSYSTWIRYVLDGTFTSKFNKGCVSSSSSVMPSSTKASSTIASSTPASTTPSATPSKSASSSSVHVSSSAPASSSASASSSIHTSSSASASSSIHASSSAAVSSSATASSSIQASSSVHASSSAPASSSIYPTSTPAASSSVPASSNIHSASYPAASSSSIHSASTPAASSSASHSAAPSSVPDISSTAAPYPSGNVTYPPYPTGTHGASPSIVYPEHTTKSVYPHSSETLVYPSPSSTNSVHYPVSNATTSCTSSTAASSSSTSTLGYPVYEAPSHSAPVYGASSALNYPGYVSPSSTGKGYESYPAPSSVKVDNYPPSATTMPGNGYPAYPASSTKTVITTTYIDSCETGVTTKTETITQTVCNKCQGDSVTSVYVCNKCGPSVITYTITKPATPATNVPSVPTAPSVPSGPSYGGEKPQESAKPSTPSYGSDKPSYPPTYEVPKKQEAPASSTTVEIVYITKTPVPVLPSVQHTPIPYPTAPAFNGTIGYPVKPTGTGVSAPPTKPTTYVPPPQFTGAASHVGVGMTGMLAVVAGLLVL